MNALPPAKVIRPYLLAAACFVAIVAVNVFVFTKMSDQKPAGTLASENPSAALNQTHPSDLLPVEKLKGLAAAEVPDVPITKIELQPRGDQLAYVVSLANDTKLEINAKTGAKLSSAALQAKNNGAALPPNFSPTIDFALARQIALTQKPDVIIESIELSTADGNPVYNIIFADGTLVIVAATTGAVVSVESGAKEGVDTSNPASNAAPDAANPSSPQSNTNTDETDSTSPTTPGTSE